ncbi:MAG: cation-transporting P-type ATPase [Thermomicrobiales bacterium]
MNSSMLQSSGLETQGGATAWHALQIEQVAELLGANRAGLTLEEAAQRLARIGPNSIQGTAGSARFAPCSTSSRARWPSSWWPLVSLPR